MADSRKTPPPPRLNDRDVRGHVSMQHERLVGRLMISWARLEAIMQDTIWTLLGVDSDDGRVLTAKADANRKIQWLRALAKSHLSGEDLESLTNILNVVDTLKDDRNFVAHASWFTTVADNLPIGSSYREKADPGMVVAETFSADRMREVIRRIDTARFALVVWDELHKTSRGKSPPLPADA
jgi:hypothetical protein